MVKSCGVMFAYMNVRRVNSTWSPDKPVPFHGIHPDHDEHDQTNIKHTKAISYGMFHRKPVKFREPDTQTIYDGVVALKQSGTYPADSWRGKLGLTRGQYRSFQREFFDVFIPDHDFEAALCKAWLSYHRGSLDPRSYNENGWSSASARAANPETYP